MAKNIFIVSSLLKLDLNSFKSDLQVAVQHSGQAARTIEKTFFKTAKGFESWGAKMAVLGGGMFAGMAVGFKALMDAGGDLSDLSKQLGMSTAALSELGYAASLSGINMDTLTTGLGKMEKFLAGNDAKDVLKSMGLDAASIQKAAPDEAFAKIIDGLGKVQSQNKRMDLAQAIFGKGGAAFLRQAKDGAAGIAELRKEAQDLGISVDDAKAAKLDEMGDKFDSLMARAGGLAKAFKIQLAPAIDWLIDRGTETIKWLQQFTAAHPAAVNWIAKLTVGASALTGVLGVALISTASFIRSIATLAGATKTVLGWFEKKTAKTIVDTAATVANTEATIANTAAKVANGRAYGGLKSVTAAGDLVYAGEAAAGAGAGAAAGMGILGSAAAVLATGAVAYGGTRWIMRNTGGDRGVQDWMMGHMDTGQDSESRLLGERTRQIMARSGGGVDEANRKLMEEQNKKLDQLNETLRQVAGNTRGSGPNLMPVLVR